VAEDMEEELRMLDVKLKQLKLDYEQYFLGTRPREPQQQRSEIQKIVLRFQNSPINNTANRFKFNSINNRFQSFKRQWDSVLRQIEAGTYKRHIFKADLRDKERGIDPNAKPARAASGGAAKKTDLFETYREAAQACGQSTSGLTREKLASVVAKQEKALKAKLGCDKVNFKVVVKDGKVKLKASAG